MADARRQIVVGLGEVLWDCFADERRPGGAPANVAYHAAQLGHDGVVCSRVGRDEPGDALVAYLASRGLGSDHIQRDAQHATGRVTVDASDPDSPGYVIHEDTAWDHLVFEPSMMELVKSAAAVCFGTLAQRSPTSRATIHRVLDAATGALTVYDVNLRQSWYDQAWIERSLHAARIVKLNIDEVGVLNDLLAIASTDARDFGVRLLNRYDLDLVCITRGADGCLLIGDTEIADIPGKPVRVVDAVGAGDAFCAAMISAQLAGWPIDATARFANDVGGVVAGCSGAMPDVASEYAKLRERYTVNRSLPPANC